MGRSTIDVTVCLCFAVVTLFSFATGQGVVGGTMSIKCGVVGTYTYPGWIKDSVVIITTEDSPEINPIYVSRIKYNTDKTTLMVTQLESSDAGNYSCTVSSIGSVPTTVTVNLFEEIPDTDTVVTCCKVIETACVFFFLVILVLPVVIMVCIHILIEEHKRQKEDKENGETKNNDGQNGHIGTKEDRNRKQHKLLYVLVIITAAVTFIAVSAWLIVMLATVEDCKEMNESKCQAFTGLLAFEALDFVLGVGFVIYLFYSYRGSTNKSNADDTRNHDHPNYSTSTKKVQELNQQGAFP